MLNNASSSSGHVQGLCVHVEVCMQPSESVLMCVCNTAWSHENSANVGLLFMAGAAREKLR